MSSLINKLIRGLSSRPDPSLDKSVYKALEDVHTAIDAIRQVLDRDRTDYVSVINVHITPESGKFLVANVSATIEFPTNDFINDLDFYIINKSGGDVTLTCAGQSVLVAPSSVKHVLISGYEILVLS